MMAQAVKRVSCGSAVMLIMTGVLVVCVRVGAESSVSSSEDSRVLRESAEKEWAVVFPRQSGQDGAGSNSTSQNNGNNGNSSNIGQYWYVFLVVFVVLLVVCVFLCACIVRNRHCCSQHSLQLNNHLTKTRNGIHYDHGRSLNKHGSFETSAHHHTNSTDLSPASLSVGTTPIPSPQPLFASQNSLRSSGRNSARRKKRNHSPGHSSRSGSEETIKPGIDTHSVSSYTSSAPSTGHGSHLNRTQSLTSERVVFPPRSSRGHRRTTSNPLVMVSITSGIHDDGSSSLHSAPSTSSMLSVGSNQSTKSGHSQSDASSQQTVVEVDVKVHLSPDQEQEARMVTAAALAESARQLAQSAADFGKDEELYKSTLSHHRSYLPAPRVSVGLAHPSPMHGYLDRRHLFPSHSSSHLSGRGEYGNSQPCSPRAVQTVSLDRPVNSVSLDRPIHTFPIPHDRYRHEFRPSPSPLLANREGFQRSSVATGTEAQFLNRRPYYSHVSEPRIGRPDLELQQRQSPIAVERDRPPMKPFHTLESYPYRPRVNEMSEFHSLKAQRSRTINGTYMLPVHPNSGNRGNRMELKPRLEFGPRTDHKQSATGPSLRGTGMEPDRDKEPDPGIRNRNGTREREQGARSPAKPSPRHDDLEAEETAEEDDDPGMIEDGDDTLKAGQHLVPPDLATEEEESEKKSREYPDGLDSRYLTLPHHYSAGIDGGRPGPGSHPLPLSPTSSSDVPSQIQEETPSKPRRVKQRGNRVSAAASDPDLRESGRKSSKEKDAQTPRDLEAQAASIASNSSTIPHSPSSSTCLSSRTSSLQSVAEDSKKELPSNSTLERQNSLPNVHHDHQTSNPTSAVPNHSKTLSLPRSSSGLSMELEGQLSSTASGYAATGSGSSLDAKSFGAPQLPNHRLKQYSYPLQNFLAQPYNPETDGFDFLDESLDSPLGFQSSNMSMEHMNHHIHSQYQPNQSRVALVRKDPTPRSGYSAGRHVSAGLAKVNPSSDLYPDHDHVNITVEV